LHAVTRFGTRAGLWWPGRHAEPRVTMRGRAQSQTHRRRRRRRGNYAIRHRTRQMLLRRRATAVLSHTFLILGAALGLPSPAHAQSSAAAKRPVSPCPTDASRHRFDFWIGEWKVETPDGKPAGHSVIQAIS